MSHRTKCIALVRGRRIRLTRLDNCGRPVFGEDSVVITGGFIAARINAVTTETEAIDVKRADGKTCIYEPAEQNLVGYSVEIQFCNVDPELLSIATGQPVVVGWDGSTVVGFDVDTKVELKQNFALEIWSGAPSDDACEDENAEGEYGWTLLPRISGGMLGDFEIGNAEVTFTLTNGNTREGNSWGVGPYRDILLNNVGQPAGLPQPISRTLAFRQMVVNLAPPEEACGARPLLDPSVTAVTAVVVAEGDNEDTADFTFTGGGSNPVWIDFGDGTWDYVGDASDGASHEYDTPGTYVVSASSNGVWVTANVTIPFP